MTLHRAHLRALVAVTIVAGLLPLYLFVPDLETMLTMPPAPSLN